MTSTDLAALGFGQWHTFGLAVERDLLAAVPKAFGVYSMRFAELQPRLLGLSDLAYVGNATNSNGLLGRIRQYFHPGWQQSTNLAMKARLSAGLTFELAFVVLLTAQEAEQLESRLLIAFEAEHGERPHFNRQAALASVLNPLETTG